MKPKKKDTEKKPEQICIYCGFRESSHYAVNYADGPHVSGVTLVCPKSTFQAKSE